MAKACKYCNGTGKLEIQRPDPTSGETVSVGVSICMACDGTGRDRHWHERACADCGQTFGYDIQERPAPILCAECREKYKQPEAAAPPTPPPPARPNRPRSGPYKPQHGRPPGNPGGPSGSKRPPRRQP